MVDIKAFNVFTNDLKNYNKLLEDYKKQNKKLDDMIYLASGCRGLDPSKEHYESVNMSYIEELKLDGVDDREKLRLDILRIKLQINYINEKLKSMPPIVAHIYRDIYIKGKSYFKMVNEINSNLRYKRLLDIKEKITISKLKTILYKEFEV